MRGKAPVVRDIVRDLGITPAYAGKSGDLGQSAAQTGDHPRVCGEKDGVAYKWLFVTGSPPRMRGKVQKYLAGRFLPRITPAYAGKSALALNVHKVTRDHPRVCGEKSFKTSTSCGYKGSPPRMRGKAPVRSSPALHSGITPAYAGKSKGCGLFV